MNTIHIADAKSKRMGEYPTNRISDVLFESEKNKKKYGSMSWKLENVQIEANN